MKTSKWLKMMLSFVLVCLFTFAIPSYNGNAATSTKAKVVTKTYKKILDKPSSFRTKSKTAQKKVNQILYKHVQGSYKEYLKLKKDMEAYKKEANCKEYPESCQYKLQHKL